MLTLDAEPVTSDLPLYGKVVGVSGRWWVAAVDSGAEFRYAERLSDAGLIHFLPYERVRGGPVHHRRQFDVPLFPGYVFLCEPDPQLDSFPFGAYVPRIQVHQVLRVVEQRRLIGSLEALEAAMRSGQVIRSRSTLSKGQLVEVIAGPLLGQRGRFEKVNDKGLFVLRVDFIQKDAEVEIDPADVEPL